MNDYRQLDDFFSPDDGIEDISITEVSLKNSTYIVSTPAGARVRKQYAGSGAVVSRRSEITAYRRLREVRTIAGRPILPALLDVGDGDDRVDIDVPPGSRSVRDAGGVANDHCPGWAAAFGEALGALHGFAGDLADFEALEPPWIMELPEYRFYQTLSSASRDLLHLLYTGRGGWETPPLPEHPWRQRAITHADIKWSNVLLLPGETGPEVRLIDWELCGIGDPAWDAGSFFSEFLLEWATSIPTLPGEPADRYAHLADRPIEGMQLRLREFWSSYTRVLGVFIEPGDELLMAATRYAGARLIQSAFERAQTLATVSPQLLLLVQLGLNVMREPEEAAERLLGLTQVR